VPDDANTRAIIVRAAAELAAAGLPSPRVDAELLAAHVLGVPRGRLLLAGDLDADQLRRMADLVARRRAHEPLQHLTGRAPFRQLDLAVGPGVFVPRPETELLVEWALGWARSASQTPATIVDLCAGSGAIALAVAAELRPTPQVYAVERDPTALEWLRRNASSSGVAVVAGDVLDPAVLADVAGAVDLVLCNPPYVPRTVAGRLPVDVTGHDPQVAVFAGADGLELIRPLVGRVAALLRPGGAFAVEHDDSHGESVPELLRVDGRFDDVKVHHDLAGRPRFTTATLGRGVPEPARGWQDGAS
jgi:release factor glutamine methyltransferase